MLGDESVGEAALNYQDKKADVCMANSAEGFDVSQNANFFDAVPRGGVASPVGLSLNNINVAVPVLTGPAGIHPTIIPLQVAERLQVGN
ncbi:MAG: hypothetical protein ACJAYV_001769 [Oleispira sp.]